MKTSDNSMEEPLHLDDRPELEAALREILVHRLCLYMAESADGSPCIRCAPAKRITGRVRVGLRTHNALVRHVLSTWGDGYGFLLLCALWAGDVPEEPFMLRREQRVTYGARFIRELRRVAVTVQRYAPVYTGAFEGDVADLIWRPGFQPTSSLEDPIEELLPDAS